MPARLPARLLACLPVHRPLARPPACLPACLPLSFSLPAIPQTGSGTPTMARLNDFLLSCFSYGTVTLSVFLYVPFKMSKKLHEAFFARLVYPLAMYFSGDRLTAVRRHGVSQLDDLVSHDGTLKKEGTIRVLEIGTGFGANFEYMQRNVKYWSLDPNAEFDYGLRKNLKKNPNVELERCVHEYAEDMRGVPDDHFDAVLMTFVLCSVTEACRAPSSDAHPMDKVVHGKRLQQAVYDVRISTDATHEC
ncbi:conserved hypothetical protein [Ixodes scapularis]|uniref:Methyltransferase type 11 domain-containing protein n=1 Tax=Ixodes scapularis TaxID=6945 RepID=B7Q9P4_IXOSC|nr:conserved hypothetical protein [Ixodes scapularis]|eukprot:XP_002412530.1 conserved hypothetical protein [Ixodes scapularis]